MKPWEIISSALMPGGAKLQLSRRDEEYVVRVDGQVLMSSRAHHSEDQLAAMALSRAKAVPEKVLVGGLGMGFTVRAALDVLPRSAQLVVCELSATLVEWNKGPLSALAGHPLQDSRVQVQMGDVAQLLSRTHLGFGAVLLDVDNGPTALSHPQNDRLYGSRGIGWCLQALTAGGVLGVWSAGPELRYKERLEQAGFGVQEATVTERPDGGRRHHLFLAVKGARR